MRGSAEMSTGGGEGPSSLERETLPGGAVLLEDRQAYPLHLGLEDGGRRVVEVQVPVVAQGRRAQDTA